MPQVNVKGVGIVNFPDEMSQDQIKSALNKITSSKSAQQQQPEPQQQQVQQSGNGITEGAIGQSLKGFAQRTTQRGYDAMYAPTVAEEVVRDKIPNKALASVVGTVAGAPERLGRSVTGAFGTVADALVNVPMEYVYRNFVQPADQATGNNLVNLGSTVGRKIGSNKIVQGAANWYNELRPEEQANFRLGMQGLEVIGVPIGQKAVGTIGKAVERGTANGKGFVNVASAPKANTATAGNVSEIGIQDISKGKPREIMQATGDPAQIGKVKQPGLPFLKELSPNEARIMTEKKADGTISFDDYAKQAEIRKGDLKAIHPAQLAATNASKAFDEIDQMRDIAGKKIKEIVQNNNDKVIDISDVKTKLLEEIEDKIGGTAPNQISKDPAALKAAEEIANDLFNLPDQITPENAWNLKQQLRNKVKYDASGQLRPNSTKLESIQKSVSNLIDKKMDDVLDGFDKANEEYSKIVKVENAFSRALGAEFVEGSGLTKHGASIMKRALQSNADSDISSLFMEVKNITGGKYDLFQDAAYANIAMRLSGDADQFYKAARFGGVAPGMLKSGSGGDISQAIQTGLNVAGKAREKVTGGKLTRVADWYKKEQAKHSIKK